jgi:hypothetical protein
LEEFDQILQKTASIIENNIRLLSNLLEAKEYLLSTDLGNINEKAKEKAMLLEDEYLSCNSN